ncbi:hypothetical protein GTB64_004437 [Salmonella enterica]|nr:hypothetical protein [Salmonella enterica]
MNISALGFIQKWAQENPAEFAAHLERHAQRTPEEIAARMEESKKIVQELADEIFYPNGFENEMREKFSQNPSYHKHCMSEYCQDERIHALAMSIPYVEPLDPYIDYE